MKDREAIIRGVTHDTNVVKIAVLGVPDQPGVAYKVFSKLAKVNIDVDMIVQSIRNSNQNINDIVFTIMKTDLENAQRVLKEVAKEIGCLDVIVSDNVAKISIVGAGMLGIPGIAASMFGALGDAGINIEVISTSEISVSCLINEAQVEKAVNAIHKKFFP